MGPDHNTVYPFLTVQSLDDTGCASQNNTPHAVCGYGSLLGVGALAFNHQPDRCGWFGSQPRPPPPPASSRTRTRSALVWSHTSSQGPNRGVFLAESGNKQASVWICPRSAVRPRGSREERRRKASRAANTCGLFTACVFAGGPLVASTRALFHLSVCSVCAHVGSWHPDGEENSVAVRGNSGGSRSKTRLQLEKAAHVFANLRNEWKKL